MRAFLFPNPSGKGEKRQHQDRSQGQQGLPALPMDPTAKFTRTDRAELTQIAMGEAN